MVNLARSDNMDHDDVAMYYPLSPRLAVLVGYLEHQERSVAVPMEVVDGLNETVAFFSNQFLVADSENILERFATRPKSQPDILAMLR